MSLTVVDLVRAADFAARKHVAQRRKGAGAEPYINHPLEVARMLAEATDGQDIVLLMGAILHDTVEDTDATRDEIEREFGAEVADLVAEVTDDKSLEKAVRKQRQVDHTPHKSARAKQIKLADKTSNLRALGVSPPADWDHARKQQYFEWAGRVAAGCRGVNGKLEAAFDEAHRTGLAALES
ncbi:MAG: HD domain-containing protein [Kofleriaceae bacterium]